jgi:hypothetical protein
MALDPVFRDDPETRIRTRLKAFMEERGWRVDITHGNKYQSGFPDLHTYHLEHGLRWIDTKNPGSYKYTTPQIKLWPKWELVGCGVWILFEGDHKNYNLLFQPPNFREFWKPRYDKIYLENYEIIKGQG